ncbi:peptidyl-prolyl cis-trans isomerase [Flavobacteriaceae bacterium]|nr:peptidyl-prolyl cis-trans isomerase [Flavobacteriaceae bacterium]
MTRFLFTLVICLALLGCDFLEPKRSKEAVARVNETYLYQEDIQALIAENTTKQDSISIVANYIQRWATQQLLIDQASINLPQQQIDDYQDMVEEYRNDLFAEAYKGAIVSKLLDSTITQEEYSLFYQQNKENFTLKEEIYKLRYIHLDASFPSISETKQKLRRFNTKDVAALQDSSLEYKGANFNDSVWVKKETLLRQLPVIRNKESKVLKKATFSQLEDSLGVYLLKIENVLSPNQTAPLQYIKPIIKEIILNKRTLGLVKELEKDITKDAVKNKNFEVYTPK